MGSHDFTLDLLQYFSAFRGGGLEDNTTIASTFKTFELDTGPKLLAALFHGVNGQDLDENATVTRKACRRFHRRGLG